MNSPETQRAIASGQGSFFVEPSDVGDTSGPLPYADTFCFFGIRFIVAFDEISRWKSYRTTYAHLLDTASIADGSGSLRFKIISNSTGVGDAHVIVDQVAESHLVDVLRRGSNRFRFRVKKLETDDGASYQVSDAFLSFKPVMIVTQRVCRFLDQERWQAYAESIIFHTVLSHVPGHFLLHAGAVSWEGKGVLLCGEANSGKTTLTLGLVRQGFKFLSDEVAFINRSNEWVMPFPRALGLRENTIGMFSESLKSIQLQPTKSLSGDEKCLVDIDQMFPGCLGKACSIHAIVFMEGFSASTDLSVLPISEALLRFMKFAHTAEDDQLKAMLTAADIVQRARSYRLRSGSISETVDMVAGITKQ